MRAEWEDYPVFHAENLENRLDQLEASMSEITAALEALGKEKAGSDSIKASDDFLMPLFRRYFGKLGLPNQMEKSNFHKLAEFIPDEDIDSEIAEKLDAIAKVAESVSSQSAGNLWTDGAGFSQTS